MAGRVAAPRGRAGLDSRFGMVPASARVVRSAAVGALGAGLAASAHVVAGGGAPDLGPLALAAIAVTAGAYVVAGGPLGTARLLALLLAAQALLHATFELAAPAATGHAHHGGEAAGALTPAAEATMVGAHLAATLALALLLARGEAWLFGAGRLAVRLVRRLAPHGRPAPAGHVARTRRPALVTPLAALPATARRRRLAPRAPAARAPALVAGRVPPRPARRTHASEIPRAGCHAHREPLAVRRDGVESSPSGDAAATSGAGPGRRLLRGGGRRVPVRPGREDLGGADLPHELRRRPLLLAERRQEPRPRAAGVPPARVAAHRRDGDRRATAARCASSCAASRARATSASPGTARTTPASPHRTASTACASTSTARATRSRSPVISRSTRSRPRSRRARRPTAASSRTSPAAAATRSRPRPRSP